MLRIPLSATLCGVFGLGFGPVGTARPMMQVALRPAVSIAGLLQHTPLCSEQSIVKAGPQLLQTTFCEVLPACSYFPPPFQICKPLILPLTSITKTDIEVCWTFCDGLLFSVRGTHMRVGLFQRVWAFSGPELPPQAAGGLCASISLRCLCQLMLSLALHLPHLLMQGLLQGRQLFLERNLLT